MAIVVCVRLVNVTFGCTAEEPEVKHKEIWETWYFWFGLGLVFLFIITSIISYLANTCKRKQQNLIRIRNLSQYSRNAPIISTISGPGGIIQPDVRYFNNQIAAEPALDGDDSTPATAWLWSGVPTTFFLFFCFLFFFLSTIILTDLFSVPQSETKNFASPLSAPYPPVEPVTVFRGSVPSQGYRQTDDYTEIVLPPGYIDSDNYKQ